MANARNFRNNGRQRSTVTEELLTEYVGELFKLGGRTLAASPVVRAIVNQFSKRAELEKLRAGGKEATRVAVIAFVSTLEDDGKVTEASADLIRRALIEFLDEFFRMVPEGTDAEHATLWQGYRKASKKVLNFLRREDKEGEEEEAKSDTRTDVLTDGVLLTLRQWAGTDDEFDVWLTLRSEAMYLLHLRARAGGDDWIDARIAYDHAYFGDATSNLLFVKAIASANSDDELVDKAIAAALNASKKDYGMRRAEMAGYDVLEDLAYAAKDAIASSGNILENWVAPFSKVMIHFATKAQIGAWTAYVGCVMLLLWGWFLEESFTFGQKGMIGFVACIISFTAMLLPFTTSVHVIEAAGNAVKMAVHGLRQAVGWLPYVPAPDPIPVRDMLDPAQHTGPEGAVRVFRWRAMLAMFTIEQVCLAVFTLFLNERQLVDSDWVVMVLHILFLGIVLSIMIKFEGFRSTKAALELLEASRKALNWMYVGVFVAFVLGEAFNTAPRKPVFGAIFGGAEVARNSARYDLMQAVLTLMVVVLVMAFLYMAYLMKNKDDRATSIGGMLVLIPVLILLLWGRGCSVEKRPPSEIRAPMAVWAKYGLDPKDSGFYEGSTASNGGAQGEDPEMQALLDEKKRIAAQLAANRARRNAVLGL